MIRPTPTPQLDPAIRRLLRRVRLHIRGYVWLEGLARAAVFGGVAFWVSLLTDWLAEPPQAVRGAILAAAAAGLLGLLARTIGRRAFVRLPDRSIALLVERSLPELGESLITAVELCDRDRTTAGCHPQMLARTCRQAAASVARLDRPRVLNPRPLRRGLTAATVLAAAIALFVSSAPQAAAVWARRNLLLANLPWPRSTRLIVEGFPQGVAKVARGADLTVIAKADLAMPQVPRVVEIRYRTQAGARHRKTMTRIGSADPATDRYQPFSYTFQSVLAPIQFDVFGGDDAVRDLRIQVVDRPGIVAMTLHCRFPPYMNRSPKTLPVSGVMQIPIGTEVTVRATANKPLEAVLVERFSEESPQPPVTVQPDRTGGRRSFAFPLGVIDRDETFLFELSDTDGIQSPEPVRLALAAVADQPPELALHLQGIGSAITPQAQLPVVGQITDDYGLAEAWVQFQIGSGPEQRYDLIQYADHPTGTDFQHALDVRPLDLQPGSQVTLAVQAADRCDLDGEPNVGSSQPWPLDVVTPDQLRTILDARELVLRERLEAIIEEAVETRDRLEAVPLDASPEEPAPESPPGSEPGDAPAKPSADELATRRRLDVERARQTSQKETHEVLGVAEGIDAIRQELINNRIDTEELKIRLQEQIAQPLRQVAETMFPELDRRLNQLQSALDDPQQARDRRRQSVEQLDKIVRAMRQVRTRMIQLEDFNQAIAILRDIIQQQKQVEEETRRKQKEKLRGLLED